MEALPVPKSPQQISSIWRQRIPKKMARQAEKDYIMWYYTEKEKGHWKRCSKCGQIKLAHPIFFSRNRTASDGLYSICKECRKKK